MLVICPNHETVDLTYNANVDLNTLDGNACQIIAQIKLFHKLQLRKDLCHNLSLNNSKNTQDAETAE